MTLYLVDVEYRPSVATPDGHWPATRVYVYAEGLGHVEVLVGRRFAEHRVIRATRVDHGLVLDPT